MSLETTMTNQDIFSKDSTYVAHTYNRFPVAVQSGHGATATDYDGKTYIDFGSACAISQSIPKFSLAIPEQKRMRGPSSWRENMTERTRANAVTKSSPCIILSTVERSPHLLLPARILFTSTFSPLQRGFDMYRSTIKSSWPTR